MKIEGTNPDTGEAYITEDNHVDKDFIDWSSIFEMTDVKVRKMIDDLDISADAKSLIYSFSKVTIKAGEFIIKIGRKIIDFICKLFSEFPNATFGMIFGAIAGFLVASIPVLGMIAPLITPILIGLGMAGGLKEDIRDKALVRKIAEINAQFSPLRA